MRARGVRLDLQHLSAQELAAAALSHLSGDSDENVRAIFDADGIEPLVEMLNAESPEGQAHAAAVLSDMTRVFREEVVEEGCIETLVRPRSLAPHPAPGARRERVRSGALRRHASVGAALH